MIALLLLAFLIVLGIIRFREVESDSLQTCGYLIGSLGCGILLLAGLIMLPLYRMQINAQIAGCQAAYTFIQKQPSDLKDAALMLKVTECQYAMAEWRSYRKIWTLWIPEAVETTTFDTP